MVDTVDRFVYLVYQGARCGVSGLDSGGVDWEPSRPMFESLVLAPSSEAGVFIAPDGRRLTPPAGWECLPPGDAGLTRRVKQAGPSWAVIEKKGRKAFSKGLWAPAENIAAARAALDAERSTDSYARRRQADVARRTREQESYVQSFEAQVLQFLAFAPSYRALGEQLAARVTQHATPVGSGTVARTERIPIERRAEAAVIAWLRHQTTAYDELKIPRIKGMRREVRRDLAEHGRVLLNLHRRDAPHAQDRCPLCIALQPAQATQPIQQGAP